MELRSHYYNLPIFLLTLCGLLLLHFAECQECDAATGICDRHERCPVWKDEGECLRNAAYMTEHCPIACQGVQDSASEQAKVDKAASDCTDQHERCKVWAELGECKENADMVRYCRKSCKICQVPGEEEDEEEDFANEEQASASCTDEHANCNFWAQSGECEKNPRYMHVNCAKSCGTCARDLSTDDRSEVALLAHQSVIFGDKQKIEGAETPKIVEKLKQTLAYLDGPDVAGLSKKIRKECKNRHELCTFWAVIGECENNKAYMATNCAAACESCHLIEIAKRCPPIPDAVPGLTPGALNRMFYRIVMEAPGNKSELSEDEFRRLEESKTPIYSVTVHSQPSEEPLTDVSVVQDKSLPPWVITFDNFTTPEECQELINLGYEFEYKRSEDVGGQNFDGSHKSVQSEGRTSENAWCSEHVGCRQKEVPQRIHDRMAAVMGIPPENSEDLQLLKYEKGQFYKTHHDYIPHQKDRQSGPRILTFFLYLSDVDAGGGTNFPNLGITVEPKVGRALLWPSVLDAEPSHSDSRMKHQALPVEEGTKFAANGWIHLYDYQTPQKNGCT